MAAIQAASSNQAYRRNQVPDRTTVPYWVVDGPVVEAPALQGDARTLKRGTSIQASFFSADPVAAQVEADLVRGAIDGTRSELDDGTSLRISWVSTVSVPAAPDLDDLEIGGLVLDFTVTGPFGG